jgi:hypothetical protein
MCGVSTPESCMPAAMVAQSNSVASHLRSVHGMRRVGSARQARPIGFERMGPAAITDISARNVETRYAVQGVNRTISTLESADGAAESVQQGLSKMRHMAAAAGNLDLPGQIRADLSSKFDQALEAIAATAKDTAEAGQRVADGSARVGTFEGETVALPPTDVRPEYLGIAELNLWTPQGAMESIDIIDAAIGEVAAQRAEISAAGMDVLGSTSAGLSTTDHGGASLADESRMRADRGMADDADFADSLSRTVSENLADGEKRSALGRTHVLDRNAALKVLGLG